MSRSLSSVEERGEDKGWADFCDGIGNGTVDARAMAVLRSSKAKIHPSPRYLSYSGSLLRYWEQITTTTSG